MSWQAYIDQGLIGTNNVDEAAIFSIDGESLWAASKNFKIQPEEMKIILDAFRDSSAVHSQGFRVNNNKYTVINVTDKSLWAKKGKEGLVVVRTQQALLLAHHPDTVTTNACVFTVENLGDYLTSVGY
ncbi:profilin-A [Trichodelitschia bisporula]|uniref:Profilin n=1 Tax=Trichodelitschia bisporula TaxID=703511 RepID=A0A6G1HRJ8_9PEZI|nr:profilin-A [Trichodelitschia bisporula]